MPARFLAAGANGQPGATPTDTQIIEPRAGGADFDDSSWPVIAADTLSTRRSTGRVSFNWYRLSFTLPESLGGAPVAGRTVSFEARVDDYDALLLPGGVMNPDRLRTDKGAVNFVRSFFDAEKPVAAICHGPIMLIEAEVLRDRHLTSWPSLATDMRNAGARWSDEEVVVDRGLVTSRQPTDIPAFNRKMIEEFAEGAVSTRMDRNSVEA